MTRRSPARVLGALALAAGVVLTTTGTAGASPTPVHGRGGVEHTRSGPDTTHAAACPGRDTADGDAEGPPTASPDPRVTNPGPGEGECPPEDPAPDPGGDPPATPAPPPDDPAPDPGDAPDGGVPASPAPRPAEPPAPQATAAPTATLRTLAAALETTMNGVTARVWAPPGLAVGPVEITVLFGGDKLLTAEYDNGSGTLLKHHFPHLHGTVRTEILDITLRERSPGGPRMHSTTSTVRVEPQFDITLSRLTVDIDGSCDLIGSPEATVYWMDADGVQHRYDENNDFLAPGQTFGVPEFAFSARRAGPARALTLPTFTWYERDPGGSIGDPGLPRGPQLLPRPDSPPGLVDTELPVRVAGLAEGDGDDCTASFSYTIRYHPVLG